MEKSATPISETAAFYRVDYSTTETKYYKYILESENDSDDYWTMPNESGYLRVILYGEPGQRVSAKLIRETYKEDSEGNTNMTATSITNISATLPQRPNEYFEWSNRKEIYKGNIFCLKATDWNTFTDLLSKTATFAGATKGSGLTRSVSKRR